jgi:hypothetical protein
VILIEPHRRHPAARTHALAATPPRQPPPRTTPAVAAAIVRIIAESATALARHKAGGAVARAVNPHSRR